MDESQQLMGQNERLKSYRTLVLVFLGFIVCFIDRSAMNIALAYVGMCIRYRLLSVPLR